MIDANTLARPYAKAAFAYAQEHKNVSEWAQALAELAEVVKVPEMGNLLRNPKLSSQQIIELVMACVKNISKEVENFIQVLASNQRMSLLPTISHLFEQYKAETERTIKVHITSAFELSADQSKQFEQVLGKSLQRQVFVESTTDANLIGGAVIRAGDQVIDGSVRGRLEQLADSLMNG